MPLQVEYSSETIRDISNGTPLSIPITTYGRISSKIYCTVLYVKFLKHAFLVGVYLYCCYVNIVCTNKFL